MSCSSIVASFLKNSEHFSELKFGVGGRYETFRQIVVYVCFGSSAVLVNAQEKEKWYAKVSLRLKHGIRC